MSFGLFFNRSHSGPGPDRQDRGARPYRGEPRTVTRNHGYTREIYSDRRDRRAERQNQGDRRHQQYHGQPTRRDAQAKSTESQDEPRYRDHHSGEEEEQRQGEEEDIRHPHHRGTPRKNDDDEKYYYYYASPSRGKAEEVPSRPGRRPGEEGTKERRGGDAGPRPQHRAQDDDGGGRRNHYNRAPQQQQQQQQEQKRQPKQRDTSASASASPRPRVKSGAQVVDEAYKQTHESWELRPIKHRRRPGDVPYEKSLAYHLTNSWWPKG